MNDSIAPVIWIGIGLVGGSLLALLIVLGVVMNHLAHTLRTIAAAAGHSGIDNLDTLTDADLERLLQQDDA